MDLAVVQVDQTESVSSGSLGLSSCFFYLSFAQSNGHVLRASERLERNEQMVGEPMGLVEHNVVHVALAVDRDAPGATEDVAHQALHPQALDGWHSGKHPALGPGQHVVRQRPQEHHHLLGSEAFLAALGMLNPAYPP